MSVSLAFVMVRKRKRRFFSFFRRRKEKWTISHLLSKEAT
jgi:hypothetical protein